MKILSVELRRFRGVESLILIPNGHVVVGGEPRAGRSTLVEALFRTLSPHGARGSIGDDLDLYDRNRDHRAEVEVILGDLGADLSQRFFDQLEFWDAEEGRLVEELDSPEELEDYEQVVRLCYRLRWLGDQEQAEQWVDFPKAADPENDVFPRVRRVDLEALPMFFNMSRASPPLSLSYRGGLREIVDRGEEDDFADALNSFAGKVEALGDELGESAQLVDALREVMEPVVSALGVDVDKLSEQVSFVPAGVALGALLRALEPTLQLNGDTLALPLTRHGSTAAAVLVAAELLARGKRAEGVVVLDDFGEELDGPTARHLVSLLRRESGQAWITTRRAEVADAFRTKELIRLSFDSAGKRTMHQGKQPESKAERTAARHIALQLLPAMTARAVIVLEGPHDRAGLQAVAERCLRLKGTPLPAGKRVVMVDAGAADSSGGSSAIPRLCAAAGALGLFTVAVIDGDPGNDEIAQANLVAADVVIRLPDGIAIERALVDGLSDDQIRRAFQRLDVNLPPDFDQLADGDLRKAARKAMKARGGVHAEFIDALRGKTPKLAARILAEATRCAVERDSGLVQL